MPRLQKQVHTNLGIHFQLTNNPGYILGEQSVRMILLSTRFILFRKLGGGLCPNAPSPSSYVPGWEHFLYYAVPWKYSLGTNFRDNSRHIYIPGRFCHLSLLFS